MVYRYLFLTLGILLGMETARVGAQPVPIETGDDSSPASRAEAGDRDMQGKLDNGFLLFDKGDLRGAYNEATEVLQSVEGGALYVRAALLRSVIYLRAGVLPLGSSWAQRAVADEPDNVYAQELLKLLEEKKAGNYTFRRSVGLDSYPGYDIDVWRGDTFAAQARVLVFRKDNDFRGALALEPSDPEPAEDREPAEEPAQREDAVFDLRFYDLEGAPIAVTYYGLKQPAEEELLSFAKDFNPAFGVGCLGCHSREPNAARDPWFGKNPDTILRAELEALDWQRAGVAPYAARWANYALKDSKVVGDRVREPLEKAHRWNWEFIGSEEWAPPPGGSGFDQSLEIRKYANKDIQDPEQLKNARGPLEHFHFVLESKSDRRQYLGSFQVTSVEPLPEKLPGERIYYLSFLLNGQDRKVKRYDEPNPPTLKSITSDVKNLLEEPQKK